MVSEEIGLNDALEAAGYHVVETDLGEYIIQLAKEPPSHIIVPAVHKTRAQVADLFDEHHRPLGYTKHLTEVSEMVNEARQVLREHYFKADVGITGGNFLIAETGSSIIVTNEGNGDLTQTLARVHIVTSGIERVVPTLDDATTFLRLLARSATGQETETYTTVSTGPRRADDLDGPQEYHVVLVDNGRSKMLGGPFREMLRCIRCGACLNHCPVYTSIGGHAYGWVYPGPMGSVLTPLINGIDTAYDLPNACTLNGRCQTVCPVKIPLPGLLRELRRQQFETGLTPAPIRWALQAWAALAKRAAAVPPGDAHRHPAAEPLRPAPRRTRAGCRWPAAGPTRATCPRRRAAPSSRPGARARERGHERGSDDGRDRVLADIRKSLGRSAPRADAIVPLPGSGPAAGLRRRPRSSASSPRCWRSRPRWCASPRSTRSAPRSQRFLASIGAGAAPVRVEGARRHRLAGGVGDRVPRRRARGRDQRHALLRRGGRIGRHRHAVGPRHAEHAELRAREPHRHRARRAGACAHFEDVWALWRATGRPLPRTLNIISGPSRTADIEQTIQLGAHGPRRLHILLLAAG